MGALTDDRRWVTWEGGTGKSHLRYTDAFRTVCGRGPFRWYDGEWVDAPADMAKCGACTRIAGSRLDVSKRVERKP